MPPTSHLLPVKRSEGRAEAEFVLAPRHFPPRKLASSFPTLPEDFVALRGEVKKVVSP